MAQGPLAGVKIVEFAGIGPGPFCGMLLSDMGADVIRIDRPGNGKPGRAEDVVGRGRRSIGLNLKDPADVEVALKLIAQADALIEGFRPGVMERNGLGPDVALARNPKLVYGRMTGWGQTGPLAHSAGHDLTYLAITGALSAIGPADHPVPPLNLVGDFAAGSMYLVSGMLAAILAARETGRGQVVDAAITDGVAHLMAMISGLRANGLWRDQRQANLLDGGAPYYSCYPCACGGFLAIAAIEPQFWAELVRQLGLSEADLPDRADPANWAALRAILAARIATRSRDDWATVLEGTDACAAPVLSLDEAPRHPHNRARGAYSGTDPRPAPLMSAGLGALREGRRLAVEEARDLWR